MNITSKGQEQWMLEFNGATKALIGRCLTKAALARLADELTEEWFRQASPREVARTTVAKFFRQNVRKATPCGEGRKAA